MMRYRLKYLLSVVLLIFFFNLKSLAITWYTLASGNWDSASIWTMDPAGMLINNPDNYTPTTSPSSATDNVVILSGRYVTVSSNAKSNNTLTVTGSLDLTTTSGHSFNEIRGSGKIYLAEDNFPSGNATHFISENQGEGTVIYYGTTDTLTTARTFYNMEVKMDNASDILVLRADYTLNGNLTLTRGIFQINDASTTSLNLTVTGTTLVKSGSGFTTGTGNTVHTVEFQGDVTNNGTIDFANDALYSCAATGAIKVIFSGSSNNTLTCNGTTDFYRMFLEKGTDETYILSVISTNTANFRLFGPIEGGSCLDAGAEGWENLALVLHHGTLKLGSNITIPALGKNRSGTASPYEFHVPFGARLWINGADVSTSDNAGGWRGFTLFGTLQVSAGKFTTPSGTGGITYFSNAGSPGRLIITGGEIYTTQLKQADASGMFSYIQTGGSVFINALSDSRGSSAVFALPNTDHTFEMSGGLVQINAVNTTLVNGIHILCDDGNYNVTGGTFEIMVPTLDAAGEDSFKIYSTAPLYNLTLTASANPNAQVVVLRNDLTVLDDLTIGANTEFDAFGYDLSIGGDLILEDGGTFTHSNNTTRFIGDSDSEIQVGNTASTAPLVFYNLEIAKEQYSNPSQFWDVAVSSPGRTAGTVPLRVTNTMLLTRGSFNTGAYNVQMYGDTLEIADGTINNETGGKITLTGSTTQHTLKGAYAAINQSFGHIDLNNTNGVKLLSDIKVTDITLTAANTLFTLDIYNLEVTNSINGSSSSKYFVTAGNGSDGGLTIHFTLTGNYSGEQLVATFPIGSPAGYSPATIYIDGYNFGATSISGSVKMAPVNSRHPGAPTPPPANSATAYYWVLEQSGFETVPPGNVIYRFYVPAGVTIYGSGQGLIDNEWIITDDNQAGLIRFNEAGYGLVSGEFTSGNPGQFNNRRTLYSRETQWIAGGYTPMNWYDRNTWSETSHYGARTNTAPQATDICVVGLGHRINATTGANITIGKLIFSHDTTDPSGFEDIPRVQVNGTSASTFNFGKIEGTGMFTQWIASSNNHTVTGDFGDFANEKYSWFLFVAENDNVTLPTTQSVFPNVATETNTGGWRLTFTQDIHINYNLNPRGTSILLLNNGADGDIYVGGNCYIGDWGDAKIQFPSTGTERTLTIMGNLDFTSAAAGFTPTNYREIQVLNTTPSSLEHTLILGGNIIQGVGILDLYNTGATGNNVILKLIGDNDGTFTRSGSERSDFYRIELNKTAGRDFIFDDDFNLYGPTNSYPKALELINGDLLLDDGDIDITLSSDGADFRIPSTTSLSLKGETGNPAYLRISGNNTGLYLDGSLILDNDGYAHFNGGTNNYIQYSSSGNAQIDIYNTELIVGSQVRRSLYTEQGILNFRQLDAASTVIIGDTDAPEGSRGVFEILNSGSAFTQVDNANIIIERQQTNPSLASLYLDPTTVNIGPGAGFTFGNSSTPASQTMGIYSVPSLQNLTVDNSGGNSPTVEMWTVPLTINENLTIQSGAVFDANGLDLIINGDFINSGTFTPDLNTTYFSGSSDQTITGTTTFYNLTKTSATNLQLTAGSTDITVLNEFDVQGGILNDNSNDIYVQGNCNFDATHIYGGSGDGLTFNGSAQQQLTGTGIFGKITIDNANDVVVPLGYNLSVTNALNLQNGVFNIGKNLLTLSLNAVIEGAPFSASNMIQTNISFTDYGVRKVLPSGASTFVYPIGSEGKYTPVTLNISSNGNSTGSITIKAADERHPSIQEDSESPYPEIVDEENVLQYHWVLRSSGISGFSAIINMKYDPSDIEVTAPYDVYDYITARLLNDGTGNWNKYDDVTKFDETNEILIFNFAGVDDAGISGDYTAGVDGSTFLGAIPDQVPIYETNNSGNWITGTIWTPNVSGGPRGAITIINPGHTVTSTSNGILTYTTMVNGEVLLNTTFAHRFGEVSGTGRIYTEREAIPAGFYDVFFSSTGGTLEYGGATNYDIMGGMSMVNNLILSGTGERRFPNGNVLLNGDLEINGGATLDVICYDDDEIEIKGNLTRTGGNFYAATGTNASIEFSSNVAQTIYGDFTGSNTLNILKVNNVNGLTLAGNTDIDKQLVLTNGAVTTGGNIFTLGLSATISPASGNSSSYINGELTKVLTPSSDFIYPVGKNGHLGVMQLTGVTGYSGTGNWAVEYFSSSPVSYNSYANPIDYVSHVEYWSVEGPAGGDANITITLDGSSDVANAVTDLADICFAGWNGSQWVQIGGTPVVTGSATSGTIATGSPIDFDTYQYITLASIEVITAATASIISGDVTICEGFSTEIVVSLSGTPNWSYTYTDGVTPVTVTGITTTTDTIMLSPVSTTTYTLTAVTDAGGGPYLLVGDTNVTVTVNPSPVITFTNSTTGDSICSGSSVIFTAGGGTNYSFHKNNSSVQGGASTTYTTSTLADQDEIFVVVTAANGCWDTSNTTTTTVLDTPVGSLTSDDPDNTFCYGTNVTFTANGGINYRFMVNASTVQNSGLASYATAALNDGDVITVEATNIEGCSSVYTGITVNVNSLPAVNLGPDIILCVDSTTILDAGAGMTGYTWSTAETSQSIIVSAAGEYRVTVTDINNCINSDTVQVSINPMTITGVITNATCYGYNDGAIDITVTGGNTPLAGYLWSNSQTTQDINSLAAGNYTVTVTDAMGCPLDSTYTVTQPANVIPTITGSDTICQATTVVYTTEAGMSNYIWSVTDEDGTSGHTITAGGGAANNSVTIRWDGYEDHTISVTYTNGAGCTATSPTELPVWVFKLPEPGPAHHIPNDNVP